MPVVKGLCAHDALPHTFKVGYNEYVKLIDGCKVALTLVIDMMFS